MGATLSRMVGLLTNRLIALSAVAGEAAGYPFNVTWLLQVMGCSVGRGVRFSGKAAASDVILGDDVVVAEGARLGPHVVIGGGGRVGAGVTLAHKVTLKESVIICNRALLENIAVGSDSMICSEVLCLGYGEGRIEIGSHSYIGPRCVLDWSDDLIIGDFVHVSGPSTAFWTHSSVYQALHGDSLDNKRRRTTAPILIGSHVYIGGNCTIYPGVKIGHHSIVLPNSAVNQDVPAECMVGGVPACIVRKLEKQVELT